MGQDNVQIIREMYASFEKGDIPGVVGAMDPQIEWNEAENFPYADGHPYIGPTAIIEGVFKRLGEEWEYWNVSIEDILDAGKSVVVLGRYTGKFNRTGAMINAQFAHVWSLSNGKVSKFQQYTDTAQVTKATGGN